MLHENYNNMSFKYTNLQNPPGDSTLNGTQGTVDSLTPLAFFFGQILLYSTVILDHPVLGWGGGDLHSLMHYYNLNAQRVSSRPHLLQGSIDNSISFDRTSLLESVLLMVSTFYLMDSWSLEWFFPSWKGWVVNWLGWSFFFVLEHQHGRHNVMWKRSILNYLLGLAAEKYM